MCASLWERHDIMAGSGKGGGSDGGSKRQQQRRTVQLTLAALIDRPRVFSTHPGRQAGLLGFA